MQVGGFPGFDDLPGQIVADNRAELSRHREKLVEVHCRCPRAVAVARYAARSPTRHAGHLDAGRQPDELWTEQNTRPTGIAPAIVVETTAPVDVMRRALGLDA